MTSSKRITVTYNLKPGITSLTFMGIENKRGYVGSINKEILMDKGLLVRTLPSLIQNGVLYRERDDFTESFLEKEEEAEAKRVRQYIIEYEKRVRKYIFGSTEG